MKKNPNEYHTDDYGTIYRTTTVSNYLGDSFGGRKSTKKLAMFVFDCQVIERLMKEDKKKITISESIKKEGEVVNTVKAPDRGGSIKLEEKNNDFTTNTTTTNNTEILDQTAEIQNNLKEKGNTTTNTTNILDCITAEIQQNSKITTASADEENNRINKVAPSSDAFTPFTYSPSTDNEPVVEEVKGFRLSPNGPIHYQKAEE